MKQAPKDEAPGCLGLIFKLFGVKARGVEQLPYARRNFLLTRAERSLFGVLQRAVGSELLIFAKVRLADLLYVKRGTEKRQSFFNRIQSKHVDFVLCDPEAVRPLLVVELDDASHNRADRRARDAFVDAALAAAGLQVLRVPAKSGYSPDQLAEMVSEMVCHEDRRST